MSSLDSNVIINVFVEPAPVEATSFGLPLHMAPASEFGGGFTARSKRYARVSEINADEASGDISAALATTLKGALAQSPRVPSVQLGRMLPGSAPQEVTLTYAGAAAGAGELHSIAVDEVVVTYTTAGADTPDVIAAGLVALLTPALTAAGKAVTASNALGVLTLVATSANAVFGYSGVTDSGTTTIATAVVQAGLDPAADLAAITAEDDGFYGLSLGSRGRGHIEALAAEVEALEDEKLILFLAQSGDLDIITPAATDVMSALQSAGYNRTGLVLRPSDNLEVALYTLSDRLAVDLDTRQQTWAYTNLTGVTPDVYDTTERAILEGKNANFYGTFKKRGSLFRGVVASGRTFKTQTSGDWYKARGEEALANLLFNATQAQSFIPFNDVGIEQCAAVVRAIGLRGENTDDTPRHFEPGSTGIVKPKASQIPPAEKAAGELTLEAFGRISGEVVKITVNLRLSL